MSQECLINVDFPEVSRIHRNPADFQIDRRCRTSPKKRVDGGGVIATEEQVRISNKIRELFDFANQSEQSVINAKKRANKIDQSILTTAFRGELVPQDPNDEPASVLLQKIMRKDISEINRIRIKQRPRRSR